MTVACAGLGRDGHVTALAIEQILHDPAGSPGLSQLRRHVQACDECADRVEAARQDSATTKLVLPPGMAHGGHLTELAVSQLALEEQGDSVRWANLHVAVCESCSARVADVARHDAALQLEQPSRRIAASGAEGGGANPGRSKTGEDAGAQVISLDAARRRRGWMSGVGVLLAASLALFVLSPNMGNRQDPEGLRLKGGGVFDVEFYVHDGERARPVGDGDEVSAGDRVGFRMQVRDGGHVLILGVDSAGSVYTCHPQETKGAAKAYAAMAEPMNVNEAMRFDDSPGHERLVAIRCDHPFSADQLREKLGEMGRVLAVSEPVGQLLPGCEQRTIVLKKAKNRASSAAGGRK